MSMQGEPGMDRKNLVWTNSFYLRQPLTEPIMTPHTK